MLKDLKITTRLTGAFGLMMAMLLGLVVVAVYQMGVMRTSTQDITGNWLPSIEHVNQMNTGTSDFRITEFQHVLNTDTAAMAAIEKDMNQVLANLEQHEKTYAGLISSDEERRLYNAFTAD